MEVVKRIKQNKNSENSTNSNVSDANVDANDEDLDSYFECALKGRQIEPSEREKVSDRHLLEQIRSLGRQQKTPMKNNIFEFYDNLRVANLIDQDLFDMVMVALSAPATQVSVERAFSGLAIVLQSNRMNIKGTKIDDVLICGLNRELINFIDFENMNLS